MSFLFRKSEPAPIPAAEQVDPARRARMLAAKAELDSLGQLSKHMVSACQAKCMGSNHSQETLSVAEMTCVDRCVVKFLQTQTTVAKVIQERNADLARTSEAAMEQIQMQQQQLRG